MTELRTAPHPAVADLSVAAVAYLGAVVVIAGPSLPDGGGAFLAVGAGAAVLAGAGANLLGRAVPSCTPADRVTLARAVLVACAAALTMSGLLTGGPSGLPLLAVGTAAFALDAVDGPVARRTGTASADGARLDTS
ncbi:CDP-alcohol phosphatidyltransferase family protein, partial [Arthrobacter sp. 1P04PC]